jgi:hypothetical protein
MCLFHLNAALHNETGMRDAGDGGLRPLRPSSVASEASRVILSPGSHDGIHQNLPRQAFGASFGEQFGVIGVAERFREGVSIRDIDDGRFPPGSPVRPNIAPGSVSL